MKIARTAVLLALLWPAAATAQFDSSWNATGPKPLTCLFNGNQFYPGDDVCVRPGVRQTCLPDGTLGAPANDESCQKPEPARPSITRLHGRAETACAISHAPYSVGAEVCVGPNAKQICRADGSLSAPLREAGCR